MAQVQKRSTLKVWRDVIFAIFLRELRSRFNDKLGLSWAVVEPITFILMLSVLRGRFSGELVHGVPVVLYMSIGFITLFLFQDTMNAAAGAVQKNKSLFAFRQVQPISAVIAAIMFEILVFVAVVIVLSGIFALLGVDVELHLPLLFIACGVLAWLCGASAGLIFAVGAAYVPELQKIRGLVNRPMMFISGTFFSLQDMPKEYWGFFTWNPLLNAIELSRYAAFPKYGDAGVSLSYLMLCCLGMLFLSLACYHITWKQALSR